MNATRKLLAAGLGAVLFGAAAVPAVAAPVADGFATTQLGRTDDGVSGPIDIGFSVNFFGTTYSQLYVSNNGYVTFGAGQGNYAPVGLGASYSGNPIIAAFYDDVDTRNAASGITAWGQGTYAGHAAFGVTWPAVGYYANKADRLDTFQLILTDRSDTGVDNFDIYMNYGDMEWDSASTTNSASVGFNAGTGASGSYYEAPGSLVHGAFVDGGANALQVSDLALNVRSGAALLAPQAVPEPATFGLLGGGFVAAALVRRRRRDASA